MNMTPDELLSNYFNRLTKYLILHDDYNGYETHFRRVVLTGYELLLAVDQAIKENALPTEIKAEFHLIRDKLKEGLKIGYET